jgi:FAD/FMN-containing dehydrogenase
MTEAEWRSCSHPDPLLENLWDDGRGRELRMFAVGCCRMIWPHMLDPRSRAAVELAERMTREEVPDELWERAHRAAGDAFQAAKTPACIDACAPRTAACAASRAALLSLAPNSLQAAAGASRQAANTQRWAAIERGEGDRETRAEFFREVHAAQAELLRNIVGDRFGAGGKASDALS